MSTDEEGLRKQSEDDHPRPLSSGAKAAEELRRLADRLVEIARQDGIQPGSPTWACVLEQQRIQYRIADSIEESYAQIDACGSTTRVEVAKLAAARRELGQTQFEMQAMVAQLTGRSAGTGARHDDAPGKRSGFLERLRHLITPQRAVLLALCLIVPVGSGFYVGYIRVEAALGTLLMKRVSECARAPSIDQDTGEAYCLLSALAEPP